MSTRTTQTCLPLLWRSHTKLTLLWMVITTFSAVVTGQCTEDEPWGRYSASGGLYYVQNDNDPTTTTTTTPYLYSFGGDTRSDQDGRGGVVRTNFRFNLVTQCWERLTNSPVTIGYRATATLLESSENTDDVYVFGGNDANFVPLDHFWKYSLQDDNWTEIMLESMDDNKPSARWRHAAVRISSTQLFLWGGRGGATNRQVWADGWIFDASTMRWEAVGNSNNNDSSFIRLPVYRHGMAYDASRNVVWIHGGLNEGFTRYPANQALWKFDLTTETLQRIELSPQQEESSIPPRMASHVVEYIASWDALLVWGGTCADNSEFYIFHISQRTWCTWAPPQQQRPNRRDAPLWALDWPNLYVAQGDLICNSIGNGVYGIVDVHVIDLEQQQQGSNTKNASSWRMLYEPNNMARGSGNEPYCNGSNDGNCQPQPLLPDETIDNMGTTTCLADLSNGTVIASTEPSMSPTASIEPSMSPTASTEPTMWTSSASSALVLYSCKLMFLFLAVASVTVRVSL